MKPKEQAVARERRLIFFKLQADQATEAKELLIEKGIAMAVLQERKKLQNELINSQIAQERKEYAKQMDLLRNGGEQMEVDCWLVDDQEAGVMRYYDENDVEVYNRPLRASERQLTLKIIEKGA